jgi:multicomponent Na+:H+ antiporter subunit D
VTALVPLPIVIPLVGAAIAILAGRWRAAQRVVSIVALSASFGVSVALLVAADDSTFVVHRSGGWPASVGISLLVDRLAGLMLVVSSFVLLAVVIYAMAQGGQEQRRVSFHPVYLVLAAGVSASFLTTDLFNLFVAFEMMLAASYVLLTFGGRADQIRSGMSYVVISLVASTLFITMLALLYASTGTVNMADLSVRLAEIDPGVRGAFALGLLVVFGVKAGLFPLFFWLPDSYPTAPGPVTAILAGLLTKVGVYAIIRSQTLLFGAEEWMGTVLLVVAALTMVVGVLGAIAQDDMKRILAFHIISQIGYMIFGLGLFTVAGVAGAILYIVHNMIVKTALLLVAVMVERRAGSSRLSEVGGLVRSAPVMAALFALPALSLAGIPPLSGFLGKLMLIDAGLDAGTWIVTGVALGTGLLTMFSMLKIWGGVFWGEREQEPPKAPQERDRLGAPLWMVVPTAALLVATIAFSVWAGPLYDIAERAGDDLLDPAGYVEAVLDGAPDGAVASEGATTP